MKNIFDKCDVEMYSVEHAKRVGGTDKALRLNIEGNTCWIPKSEMLNVEWTGNNPELL